MFRRLFLGPPFGATVITMRLPEGRSHGWAPDRRLIVAAAAVLITFLAVGFYPIASEAGVHCGSALVGSSVAAETDAAVQRRVDADADVDARGATDTQRSGEPFSTDSVSIVPRSNVSSCDHRRSTTRTWLYSAAALAVVALAIGWLRTA